MVTLLPSTVEALDTLASLIRQHRIARRWTASELAERLGVSRQTVQRIEAGSPSVAVGTVFEAARLVDVTLFDSDPYRRAAHTRAIKAELALLPSRVRVRHVDDDF